MRPLTMKDAVGALALYTGRPDPVLVTEPDAVNAGRMPGEHHPGVVTEVDEPGGMRVLARAGGRTGVPNTLRVRRGRARPRTRGGVGRRVGGRPHDWLVVESGRIPRCHLSRPRAGTATCC